VARPDPGALPPALDLELAGNCGSRPDRTALMRELDTFLTMVEAAWADQVVLYIGDDFEDHYQVRGDLGRPVWHLRFLLRPTIEDWVIWQLHGYANVDGIDSPVDLDVMRAAASP
jgi:lysozyme